MITRKRWEAGTNPVEMLESAYRWVTAGGTQPTRDRKVRLYITGLCRQFWKELPWASQVVTDLVERVADGDLDIVRLRRPLEYIAEGVVLCVGQADTEEFPYQCIADYERHLIEGGFIKPGDANRAAACCDRQRLYTLTNLAYAAHFGNHAHRFVPVELHSIALIRDVFGNPFRPVRLAPTWQTGNAVALAHQMYESRDFGPMPILADALQDAGCSHPDVLAHCRGDSPHVRGCWVVDLVLGKG